MKPLITGPTFSEPSEGANFASRAGLLVGPPVEPSFKPPVRQTIGPAIPPVGLIQSSATADMRQSSSSGCPEQEKPSEDPGIQPNASIGATAPIEILSINDQYEECIQILSTARTDLATLKSELEQIDKKLDDKMFLTKTLQIVTRENTRKVHQKIRGVSPSQTTAVELRNLYTEAQSALSQQINVEKDLAEMERFRAENLAARNLKNNEIQAKEDEVRDLEWQCKVMDTVFNRSSVLLKVSEALVQEPEEMKIPGLIHMVYELKEKLDSNPYILDEELTPPELSILEIVYKSKKMGRVIKKLNKWWRVDILKEISNKKKKIKGLGFQSIENSGEQYSEVQKLGEISLPSIGKTGKVTEKDLIGGETNPSTFVVPKLTSESPELHEKGDKLDRKRAGTPIKSRGRGSVQAFDDESSFDRKQDARNKSRLYVPPIHSGFDNHAQSNKKPRMDSFRSYQNHSSRLRIRRKRQGKDCTKKKTQERNRSNDSRRSRSRSPTKQHVEDDDDDVIYIKTEIKKM
ncbi:hypothetical protein B9Z55_016593 [Caenorhabditis nigoni]|uniref:Uncharacterized protein n=1 Tax=Caenorhabditis nigoni TaxID=1611254 RepID=A0A2G5T5U8_9PELO|nr:hypothetical protein B9Z55_016593 [Caenorhabditis nigoni]